MCWLVVIIDGDLGMLKAFWSLGDYCLIIVPSGKIFLKTYRGFFSH